MITVSSIRKLYEYLTKILFYGVSNQYSYEYIEERISSSSFIDELELSNDDFLYSQNIRDIMKEIYPNADLENYDYLATNALFNWLGEAYFRLFFKHHKAMSFIFLYIPLEKMIDLFDLYHEMDWSQLHRYFLERVNEKPLLKVLLEKRHLSINKLSQLTKISSATLTYYAQDSNRLYEAKFQYISAISFALKINIRTFLKEINNYTYSGDFEFDKHHPLYRAYLGLYYCSYYSLDIEKRKYKYNVDKHMFESESGNLLVKWTMINEMVSLTEGKNPEIESVVSKTAKEFNEQERSKMVLVIFEFSDISESPKPYHLAFKKYGFERIYIINQDCIMCINGNYWRSFITDSINEAMITKAKKMVGGDFAI